MPYFLSDSTVPRLSEAQALLHISSTTAILHPITSLEKESRGLTKFVYE